MDNTPQKISLEEWKEIIEVRAVREGWGLEDETPKEFSNMVYGVKFDYVNGSPGYVGDLYILQSDHLVTPLRLIRDKKGGLQPVDDDTV